MINLNEITNYDLQSKITDFQSKGGCVEYAVYQLKPDTEGKLPEDEYLTHLVVARQSLERANYRMNLYANKYADQHNRHLIPPVYTDHRLLSDSGQKISNEEFLGPFFDLRTGKPLIKSMNGASTHNQYFYYDSVEIPDNQFDIISRIDYFQERYTDYSGGYAYAFLQPPSPIKIGENIQEHGHYFNELLEFFFSDIWKIQVYKWSTDCSPYFDPGKEWWGNFFWTVYNPDKRWYIGILASESD